MALDPLNFGTTLDQALNLAGIERDTLSTVEWKLFRDLMSKRVKLVWESSRWPEVCVTESRTPTQTGGNEGNYVDLKQSGQTEIGEVFNVWNKSPKSNTGLKDLTWYKSENGVQISENTTPVFIHYRKVPPTFTGDTYSQSTAYASGQQSYDSALKDFYTANQSVSSGADNSPSTQPNYWDRVEVPAFMQDYLIRGTYADYLRHNGELDRARVAEKDARDVLDHELFKLHTQEGQTACFDVVGY